MEKLNLNLFGRSAQSFDPLAFAKMKADAINNAPGDLTGHDCPKCLNRGSVAIPKEDGGVSFQDCGCMKIRRCVWEMERSGLKNIIREKTFETYTVTEPWQKAIREGAIAYADKLDGWLLFCGQSGSGKTHLCTAVCRQRLLSGDEVRYPFTTKREWTAEQREAQRARFTQNVRATTLEKSHNEPSEGVYTSGE